MSVTAIVSAPCTMIAMDVAAAPCYFRASAQSRNTPLFFCVQPDIRCAMLRHVYRLLRMPPVSPPALIFMPPMPTFTISPAAQRFFSHRYAGYAASVADYAAYATTRFDAVTREAARAAVFARKRLLMLFHRQPVAQRFITFTTITVLPT